MKIQKSEIRNPKSPLLGAHLSISKGLHKAVYDAEKLGCRALQIFTKNANSWKERVVNDNETALFKKAVEETGINEIASHTSYLINLASPEIQKMKMSQEALTRELIRSSSLEIPYVVLHPGSHMKTSVEEGSKRIAECINEIFSKNLSITTKLLLETTAGQGSSVGHKFEHIASVIEMIDKKDKIGVCFDTCHIFAAGYDIRTQKVYAETIERFDSIIGLDRLCFFHINDSKKDLASKVDRHEHIGKGFIGIKGFDLLMNDNRFVNIPKVLETPKIVDGKDFDTINLDALRNLVK